MKKYLPPQIKSYNSEHLLENLGPTQSAYANVQIRATAFNTNIPAINRYVDSSEYRVAKLHTIAKKQIV